MVVISSYFVPEFMINMFILQGTRVALGTSSRVLDDAIMAATDPILIFFFLFSLRRVVYFHKFRIEIGRFSSRIRHEKMHQNSRNILLVSSRMNELVLMQKFAWKKLYGVICQDAIRCAQTFFPLFSFPFI